MQLRENRSPVRRAIVLTALILLAAIFSFVTGDTAAGAGFFNRDATQHPSVVGRDANNTYTVTLRKVNTGDVTRLGLNNTERLAALAGPGKTVANFNDWTIDIATDRMQGQIIVSKYDAFIDSSAGRFTVTYDSGSAARTANGGLFNRLRPVAPRDPPTAQLVWIHLVTTNAPCRAGLPTPYLDPQCMGAARNLPDDDLPFHWTLAENLAAGRGGYSADAAANNTVHAQITFNDRPKRDFGQGVINWKGTLALAEWDLQTPGTVIVYDVFDWGFDFTCRAGGGGTNARGGATGDKIPSEEQGGNPAPACGSANAGVRAGAIAGALAAGGAVLLAGASWYARQRRVGWRRKED